MKDELSKLLNEEQIINTKSTEELCELRKNITKKIIVDCEFGENTNLINRLNNLGCLTIESNDIDIEMYKVNDDSEIEVDLCKLKALKHEKMIRDTPAFIVDKDIDNYNKIISNEINLIVEELISSALENIKYEHEINNSQSFITMIRKIPKPFRNNLAVIGDNISIAMLKLILSKDGYNQDDILGIKYYVISGEEGAYLLNLKYLRVNNVLKRIDKKYDIFKETYDTKIVCYGDSKIVCDSSAIKLKIISQ